MANYFEEDCSISVDEPQVDDIFDLIPPQKSNQIFTPKKVVKEMCDSLEENEPCCFDDSSKTFIDPYIKSGLYIAEIAQRLFRSEKLKEEFPDEHERLLHIFKYQVYGLAPTEIIYHIATNFVLGFDEKMKIDELDFYRSLVIAGEIFKLICKYILPIREGRQDKRKKRAKDFVCFTYRVAA